MKEKRKLLSRLAILPALAVFIGVLCMFWSGFSRTAESNREESKKLAKQAVDRAVVNCYAIEGMYPPSYDYLEKYYGVHIDQEKYFVDYQVFASNVKPVVQLLDRGATQLEVNP